MKKNDACDEFPNVIEVETSSGMVRYEKVPGHLATHGPLASKLAERAIFRFKGHPICIWKENIKENINKEMKKSQVNNITAVYRLVSEGPFAVPTGLIFVRLSEGIQIEKKIDRIREAGFDLDSILSYAPNAGWLVALSGKVNDSLNNFHRLEEIPNFQSVEPQMLMESYPR